LYVTQPHECMFKSLSVIKWCGKLFVWPVSNTSFKTGASFKLQEKLICCSDVKNLEY
jgi:hypothetical protein